MGLAVVRYKFKSSNSCFKSIPIEGRLISVRDLKDCIFPPLEGAPSEEKDSDGRRQKRRRNFDLVLSNAKNGEEYVDEASMIPADTSVFVRRIPILIPIKEAKWEFPKPNWKSVTTPMWVSAPPPGYICRRCNVAGHLIKYCPTNGNPALDIERPGSPHQIHAVAVSMLQESTLIPIKDTKGVLMEESESESWKPYADDFGDDVYAIPETQVDAVVAVSKIQESHQPVYSIPLDLLRCVLCKQVMKDAVINRRCCFRSFCNRCIRDYSCYRSACICGAMGVLQHDLVPNLTLRELMKRLETSSDKSSELPGFVGLEEMSSDEMVQLFQQARGPCDRKRKRC